MVALENVIRIIASVGSGVKLLANDMVCTRGRPLLLFPFIIFFFFRCILLHLFSIFFSCISPTLFTTLLFSFFLVGPSILVSTFFSFFSIPSSSQLHAASPSTGVSRGHIPFGVEFSLMVFFLLFFRSALSYSHSEHIELVFRLLKISRGWFFFQKFSICWKDAQIPNDKKNFISKILGPYDTTLLFTSFLDKKNITEKISLVYF